MVKHCQISQNSKFAMSLQYLIKEVRDEVDILHSYKHKSFLYIDFKILGIIISCKVTLTLFMGKIKHSQVLKVTSLKYLCSISKKEVGMEFIFCMQINIKISSSLYYHF